MNFAFCFLLECLVEFFIRSFIVNNVLYEKLQYYKQLKEAQATHRKFKKLHLANKIKKKTIEEITEIKRKTWRYVGQQLEKINKRRGARNWGKFWLQDKHNPKAVGLDIELVLCAIKSNSTQIAT